MTMVSDGSELLSIESAKFTIIRGKIKRIDKRFNNKNYRKK